MSRGELDYDTESLIRSTLDQIAVKINDKLTDIQRRLSGNLSELEYQVLDKISRLDRRLTLAEQRIKKIQLRNQLQ